METLSYGYNKPQNGDKGQDLFDKLSENVQLSNDHNHNGVNSAPINTSAIAKITQDILATSWATPVEGLYSQLVSMAGGLQFDTSTITMRETSTGKLMSLPYEKVSPTSFRVYCNNPTKNVTVIYA